jgi:cytochrome P450
MSAVELSDGKTILPVGASIAILGGPMSQDSTFYDNPEHFNGFRFYRPNKDDMDSANQQDYTGIEPGNLSWGNGRLTCPGRWCASAMIKLIIANLLLDYDLSFPPGQTKRPLNAKYDSDVHPDFQHQILLRKRRGIRPHGQ